MPGNIITVQLPNAEAVAPGQTASFRLPLSRTYHGIYLLATNLTLAEITEIRLMVNGKTLQRYTSGTQLDNVFNLVDGIASLGAGDFTGALGIHFDQKGVRTLDGAELTSFGTGLVDPERPNERVVSAFLEVDIAASATGVTLEAYATQSAPSAPGAMKVVRQFRSRNAPGAGDFEIDDLPRRHLLRRLYLSGANITDVEIRRDNVEVFKRSLTLNNQILVEDGYKVAPASGFMIDFGEKGLGSQALALDGVEDFRVICTMSGAEVFDVVMELIAPINA